MFPLSHIAVDLIPTAGFLSTSAYSPCDRCAGEIAGTNTKLSHAAPDRPVIYSIITATSVSHGGSSFTCVDERYQIAHGVSVHAVYSGHKSSVW